MISLKTCIQNNNYNKITKNMINDNHYYNKHIKLVKCIFK